VDGLPDGDVHQRQRVAGPDGCFRPRPHRIPNLQR
jgi:hypothetical protein